MASRRVKTTEPLWYLRSIPYWVYLNTDHWVILKEEFKEHLRETKGQLECARCGIKQIGVAVFEEDTWVGPDGLECHPSKSGATKITRRTEGIREPQWDVHHLTYERLGHEELRDLELLCCMCHNLEHHPESHAAKYWAFHLREVAWVDQEIERLEQGV